MLWARGIAPFAVTLALAKACAVQMVFLIVCVWGGGAGEGGHSLFCPLLGSLNYGMK